MLSRASLALLSASLAIAAIATVSVRTSNAASLSGFSASLESPEVLSVVAEQPGGTLEIRLRNTGTEAWIREGMVLHSVNLGTVKPDNHDSALYDASTWHSPNRLKLAEQVVNPGELGTFRFSIPNPIPAPASVQFRLVVEHVGWFGPTVTVQTHPAAPPAGDPAFVGPEAPAKRVEVNLTVNTLTMLEGDTAIATFPISPGKWSTPTPTGTFKIQNKTETAYSKSYGLYMPYWNAFTANGAYGIHGLPYWKTRRGIVVEGAAHIGKNVSHGCIRLGPGDAERFFAWADKGTPVHISRPKE